MLVVISDLHLTDGTSGATIRAGAFKVFKQRINDMAWDASWRADGKYKPVKRIDVILLGDILDVIRSSTWLYEKNRRVDVRPWDSPKNRAFQTKVSQITDGILGEEHNVESFKVLKSLTQPGNVTLPPATRAGKPRQKISFDPASPDRVSVEVKIHYMVGNHDWFYHLPGPAYNRIRKKVVDALGLAHPGNQIFPHEIAESPELREICRQHQAFVRHGDIYDGFNFEGDRDALE